MIMPCFGRERVCFSYNIVIDNALSFPVPSGFKRCS